MIRSKIKNCKQCGKEFVDRNYVAKFCSIDCFNKFQTKRKPIICQVCGKQFDPYGLRKMKYCSLKCYFQHEKTSRKGKGNPAYRNGSRVAGKIQRNAGGRNCEKYRNNFLYKNRYLFCENCGVNINGTMRFEVHHIVFRSEKPNHKNLHNQKNLVLLCIKCHNLFHKKKSIRNELFIERGLSELFELRAPRSPRVVEKADDSRKSARSF